MSREDPLEEEMAIHSSILARRISWTEEPGGLQSMGSQRVRHDCATNTVTSRASAGRGEPWFSCSQWLREDLIHLVIPAPMCPPPGRKAWIEEELSQLLQGLSLDVKGLEGLKWPNIISFQGLMLQCLCFWLLFSFFFFFLARPPDIWDLRSPASDGGERVESFHALSSSPFPQFTCSTRTLSEESPFGVWRRPHHIGLMD